MDKETCCPEFEPTRWDGKLIEWKNKKFIKDRVFTIFYMPISFGEVMKKLDEMIREYGSTIPDFLCLSDHTSMWNMDIYLAVDKEIPELENITISGKFFSKVYEGSYRNTGKWCKDFEAVARNRNMSIKKRYMWYTTCPKCAKKYGKNYIVIMGKTD
jgi:hypothetical protein